MSLRLFSRSGSRFLCSCAFSSHRSPRLRSTIGRASYSVGFLSTHAIPVRFFSTTFSLPSLDDDPLNVSYSLTGYPRPLTKYINDYAGMLDSNAKDTIWTTFERLDSEYRIDATVVIVNSISDYDVHEDRNFLLFVETLFNEWGIGNAEDNDGALLFIGIRDRELRVQLGDGYPPYYDRRVKQVIDDVIIPHFKRGSHQTGILMGVKALERVLTEEAIRVTDDEAGRKKYEFSENARREREDHDYSYPQSTDAKKGILGKIIAVIVVGSVLAAILWTVTKRKSEEDNEKEKESGNEKTTRKRSHVPVIVPMSSSTSRRHHSRSRPRTRTPTRTSSSERKRRTSSSSSSSSSSTKSTSSRSRSRSSSGGGGGRSFGGGSSRSRGGASGSW